MEAAAFRNSSSQRSAFFNKLKPCCLEIVKTLRKGSGGPSNGGGSGGGGRANGNSHRKLVALTDQLYGVLSEQVGYDASVLDSSMADYVFFPLLPVFQNTQAYPARLVENATKCLRLLIQHGWQSSVSAENVQHFLILLTSVVTGGADTSQPTGSNSGGSGDVPEETVVEGYRALAVLVRAAGVAGAGGNKPAALVATSVVPVFGHAVSVMLDGFTASIVPAVQLAALAAVDAVYGTVRDLEALASFLPGTVSALVRFFAAPGSHKTPRRVVVAALQVLYVVLVNTVGDLATRRIRHRDPAASDKTKAAPTTGAGAGAAAGAQADTGALPATGQGGRPPERKALIKHAALDMTWLRASAAQIKTALTTVLKLRNHESEDVRDAVQQLCLGLLDECHLSLADCAAMLVESAIVASRQDGPEHEQLDQPDQPDKHGLPNPSALGLGFQDITKPSASGALYAGAFGGSSGLGEDRLGRAAPLTATTLADLAVLYPELGDLVKATAYSWVTSLPRMMQSSDETARQRAIENLQKVVYVLDTLHAGSATLQNSVAAALRDSVVTLVVAASSSSSDASAAPSSSASMAPVVMSEMDPDEALLQQGHHGEQQGGAVVTAQRRADLATTPLSSRSYRPVFLDQISLRGTREAMLGLIASLGRAGGSDSGSGITATALAAEMLDYVRDADGLEQAAAFWLSFELAKAALAQSEEMDELLDTTMFEASSVAGNTSGGTGAEAVLDELFSFSVATLASSSSSSSSLSSSTTASYDDGSWRLEAIALEVTAHVAWRLREAFRPELIDVLYPIATCLGSPAATVRSHAVTTLNSVAAACGYGDVSELIVDNVDYMLNSVSLRLNTFDISPASAQVLTVMIRLAGPRLVPFLDDVVAAIFAALDNYHGYARFVESLFAVLGEIVQQSVKSSRLLLADSPAAAQAAAQGNRKGADQAQSSGPLARNRKRHGAHSTTQDLVDVLDRRAKRRREMDQEQEQATADAASSAGHPTRPWKASIDKDDDDDDNNNSNKESVDLMEEGVAAKPEDPKTPTYALLARITSLTQHYLTAPTPTLRKALLDLLATVAPALAQDEDAFLPLVNAVWPVVVARLYDGEPYVVIAACHALGAFCGSAGDFLTTRIKAEWHANLRPWSVRAKAEAAAKVHANSAATAGVGTRRAGTTAKTLPAMARLPGTAPQITITPDVVVLSPLAIRSANGSNGNGGSGSGSSLTLSQEPQQLASSSASSSAGPFTAPLVSAGLGRFAQAVQIWEAVAGLLIDIVSFVRLEDDVYDEMLDLLLGEPPSASQSTSSGGSGQPRRRKTLRLLSPAEETRAREALAVVNADAVWLAQYRTKLAANDDLGDDNANTNGTTGPVRLPRPRLPGVLFVPLRQVGAD